MNRRSSLQNLREQFHEIEDLSGVKLLDFVMSSENLYKELRKNFLDMSLGQRDLLEAIIRFIYSDIMKCNELVVFIDGERGKADKNYKELLAKHFAYASILLQLDSNKMALLDAMIRQVPFDTIVDEAVTYEASDVIKNLSKPHALIITDMRDYSKISSEETKSAVYRRDKVRSFLDRLMTNRMKDGKLTVITVRGEFKDLDGNESFFGTRISGMVSGLVNDNCNFDLKKLKEYMCCRVRLADEKDVSSNIDVSDLDKAFKIAFKEFDINCTEIDDILDEMKRKVNALKGRNKLEVVFNNIKLDVQSCIHSGADGKCGIELLVDSMKKYPDAVIAQKQWGR